MENETKKDLWYFMATVAILLIMVGCVTPPPVEAYRLKNLGDGEVHKMRIIAERSIRREYDGYAAAVWRAWEDTYKKAEAAPPVGIVPPSFMISITKKRDAKLQRIEANRQAEMEQLRMLHKNQIAASSGVYDAWDAQGRANAEMMQETRTFAVELGQMYQEYRQRKSIQDAAEAAAKAEEAEGVE
jgi:hypothetical protein